MPAEQLAQRRDRMGWLERRDDALRPGHQAERLDRLVIGRVEDLQATGRVERGELRPDARVVETGGDRVRLDDLAIVVLEQVRARAVQDAGRATGQGGGVMAGRDALPGRLDADRAARRGSPMNRLRRPMALEPPPTQAIATSGSRPSIQRSCAAASSPMTRWRSRTMRG